MGMRWMTGWYVGASCWFWNLRKSYPSYYSPKEKLFILLFVIHPITKLHWRICGMKIMIPVRIIYNLLFKSCSFAPRLLRKKKSQQSIRLLFYVIVFTLVHPRICHQSFVALLPIQSLLYL